MPQGAASKPYAIQVPVLAAGVRVEPGDVVFADTGEGVVNIPKSMVGRVLEWLEKRGDNEEKIKEAVLAGETVKEAFEKYR